MYRSHPNLIVCWWRTMVNGFIYLIQGLLIICTLGYVTVNWDMKYTSYCAKKDIIARKKSLLFWLG